MPAISRLPREPPHVVAPVEVLVDRVAVLGEAVARSTGGSASSCRSPAARRRRPSAGARRHQVREPLAIRRARHAEPQRARRQRARLVDAELRAARDPWRGAAAPARGSSNTSTFFFFFEKHIFFFL